MLEEEQGGTDITDIKKKKVARETRGRRPWCHIGPSQERGLQRRAERGESSFSVPRGGGNFHFALGANRKKGGGQSRHVPSEGAERRGMSTIGKKGKRGGGLAVNHPGR